MKSEEFFSLILPACLFSGCLVAASVLAAKIVQFGPFSAPAGIFAYCITYICTDVISELRGRRHAEAVIFAGVVALALTFLLIHLVLWWPVAPFQERETAFAEVFGMTPRIITAALCAYGVSQILDVRLLLFINGRTADRHLWLRSLSAVICAQFVDSIIFIGIAFYGIFPVWPLIFGQWAIKALLAVCGMPVVCAAVRYIRRRATPAGLQARDA